MEIKKDRKKYMYMRSYRKGKSVKIETISSKKKKPTELIISRTKNKNVEKWNRIPNSHFLLCIYIF